MPMMERPQVREIPGGKCWEHTFDKFELKAYVPDNNLDGQVNNYGFRAPCLLVFEENRQDMDSAVRFANETGLAKIAAGFDTSVLFVYPTKEGGWAAEDESLYTAVIAEIKMIVVYKDGIVENYDFFAKQFKGYFVRGAIKPAENPAGRIPVGTRRDHPGHVLHGKIERGTGRAAEGHRRPQRGQQRGDQQGL